MWKQQMKQWWHLGKHLIWQTVGANGNCPHPQKLRSEWQLDRSPIAWTWAPAHKIGVVRRGLQSSGWCLRGYITHVDHSKAPKLLVVQPRIHPKTLLRARLLEALRLADSLQGLREGDHERHGHGQEQERSKLPPFVLVQSIQKRSSGPKQINAGAFLGPGTIDIVRAHVDAISTKDDLDAVFVNAPLSGVQQRNLERAWGRPVLDRVGLIIEIFGAHARTKEARLQVELAALEYKKSRLVRIIGKKGRLGFGVGGEAEVVSARGRASGGQGFISGAGETEIQLQRRRISVRKSRLTSLLSEVRRTRSLHRAARRRHGNSEVVHGQGLPLVAVVGYTNAGKSSLVSALSRSSVYVDDRLFATLDPTVRSVVLPSGQKILLSDTVGFISDLPIQLVEAFRATLEEVVEADILLHVIDSSAADADEQRSAVLHVLEEIGVSKEKLATQLIEAWNKVDLASSPSNAGEPEDAFQLEPGEGRTCMPMPHQLVDYPSFESESASSIPFNNIIRNELKADNLPETMPIWGAHLVNGEVTRVATSAVKGTGLHNLMNALDNHLKKVSVGSLN